jgi:YVTN family beta-propeller protein
VAIGSLDGSVTVFDARTGKALWTVALSPGTSSSVVASPDVNDLAYAPSGDRLYAATSMGYVQSIDVATHSVTKATTTSGDSSYRSSTSVERLAVSPDGSKVYCLLSVGPDALSVVRVLDAGLNTVSEGLQVGRSPGDLAMSPDGTRLYVTSFQSTSLVVVDTAAAGLVRQVDLGARLTSVAADPSGARVYVGTASSLVVVDSSTLAASSRIPVGYASTIAVSPDSRYVYVGEIAPSDVIEIDASTLAVRFRRFEGEDPFAVAFVPPGPQIWTVVRRFNEWDLNAVLRDKVPFAADFAKPPFEVDGATARARTGGATVTWTRPIVGNATHYVVVASPGGWRCKTWRLSCSFTGLRAGATYRFTITPLDDHDVTGKGVRTNAMTVPRPYQRPAAPPARFPVSKPIPVFS